jgi:tRNA(fMet)-specific endonuclease VapC
LRLAANHGGSRCSRYSDSSADSCTLLSWRHDGRRPQRRESLLDSDILSKFLKEKNPRVSEAAKLYLADHQRLTFSAVSLYEITRGFLAMGAASGMARFAQLVDESELLPVSIPVLKRAASLWSEAYRSGRPRGDADTIIAATALESNRVLVTGNTTHFAWIPGLPIADWRSGSP